MNSITKEAIRALVFIVVSCEPLCGLKKKGNEEYLVARMKENQDIAWSDFLSGFPEDSSDPYQKLPSFAERLGKTEVDAETIYRFFGGREHVVKVSADIRKTGLEPRRMVVLFYHLVTPIMIESIAKEGESFSGVYENRGILIKVKGLIAPKKISHTLKEGDKVLIHYASIVGTSPDKKLEADLLEEQWQIPEINEVIHGLEEVDFADFPILVKLAKGLMEKYGL
jgi:hypothetical protein